jgi:hypothetical protein
MGNTDLAFCAYFAFYFPMLPAPDDVLLSGWQVQFLEADVKKLPRTFTFPDPKKIMGVGKTRRSMGQPGKQTSARARD